MRIIQVFASKIDSNQSKDYAPFLKSQLAGLMKFISFDLINLEKGRNPLNILRNIVRLRRGTDKSSITHVHFGGYLAAFVFFFGRSKFQIVSYGGTDINGRPGKSYQAIAYNLPLKIINQYVQKKASWIIVKSDSLKNKIDPIFHWKTTIIPNGVDLAFFKPFDGPNMNRVNSFVILFNYRRGDKVDHVKNLPLANATIRELMRRGRDVSLELIENTPRKEMPKILSSGDCLLLTSYSEGSPNIVKESMACNLPVISVDCGDVKWLLNNVTNSYVCEKYDSNLLADLIEKIMLNRERSNGRKVLIEKNLDADFRNKQVLEIYQKFSCNL